MDVLEEIFGLVRVTRDAHSGLFSVALPSNRQVARRYRELNIRQPIPDDTDPFWRELLARTQSSMPALRAYASSGQTSTSGTVPRVRVEPARSPSPHSPASDESRVREMRGAQVAETLSRLGFSVVPHPTNAGITVMRGKNALLAHVRRGGSLEPAPARKSAAKWVVS